MRPGSRRWETDLTTAQYNAFVNKNITVLYQTESSAASRHGWNCYGRPGRAWWPCRDRSIAASRDDVCGPTSAKISRNRRLEPRNFFGGLAVPQVDSQRQSAGISHSTPQETWQGEGIRSAPTSRRIMLHTVQAGRGPATGRRRAWSSGWAPARLAPVSASSSKIFALSWSLTPPAA